MTNDEQREIDRLREENARMQRRMSVLEQTLQGEVVERERLVTIIARAQSMKVAPVVEWPKFPENTMVQILTTNAPSGYIMISVSEGETADVIAKRLVDGASTAMRTKKATVGT